MVTYPSHLLIGEKFTVFHHRTCDAPGSDNAIKTLDELLHQALLQGASDIHFESGEDFFRVRFRIDGLLRVADMPSLSLRDAIVSRLKVLARMDIAENACHKTGAFNTPT